MTMSTMTSSLVRVDRLERAGLYTLLAFVAALQLSIAAAHILLAVTFVLWAASVVARNDTVAVPRFFWPLVVYAVLTLISAAASPDPRTSFTDSKQLVLFLIVPAVYHLARGDQALRVVDVVITVGAASAAFGIVQYGILEYDHLGRRPQGWLTHYMTYSGLLMMVTCAAVARLLFRRIERTWPALVMPALVVALVLTSTRSAWVGVCAAVALLLALKKLRFVVALPILVLLIVMLAPDQITARMYSLFDLNDPTTRDRIAMLREGLQMVRDEPLTGVGPDMVRVVYPDYRDPSNADRLNPHLHNVPMQIAAERGLPALAVWLWFVVAAFRDLAGRFKRSTWLFLPATGLAAMTGMLAAGLFEYNFGDSEFLMLLLVLITLPAAADRAHAARQG